MAEKQDKLQLLKAKYLEQLRTKRQELEKLETKVKLIQELEKESESLNGEIDAGGKYEKLGLTEAVLDAVKTIGVGSGASASGIAKHLLAQGFKPTGQNLKSSVSITLRRLSSMPNKRIDTKLESGNRLYFP